MYAVVSGDVRLVVIAVAQPPKMFFLGFLDFSSATHQLQTLLGGGSCTNPVSGSMLKAGFLSGAIFYLPL